MFKMLSILASFFEEKSIDGEFIEDEIEVGEDVLNVCAVLVIPPDPVSKQAAKISLAQQLKITKLSKPKLVLTPAPRVDLLTEIKIGRKLKAIKNMEIKKKRRMSGLAGAFQREIESRRKFFKDSEEESEASSQSG